MDKSPSFKSIEWTKPFNLFFKDRQKPFYPLSKALHQNYREEKKPSIKFTLWRQKPNYQIYNEDKSFSFKFHNGQRLFHQFYRTDKSLPYNFTDYNRMDKNLSIKFAGSTKATPLNDTSPSSIFQDGQKPFHQFF